MSQAVVLSVDDEPSILRLLRLTLQELDCETVGAASAEEALRRLDEVRPDVVITDYRLPGMTGTELAEHIKSREDTANVPVVLISAYVPPVKHMADHFIAKPIDIDELVSVVQAYLEAQKKSVKE